MHAFTRQDLAAATQPRRYQVRQSTLCRAKRGSYYLIGRYPRSATEGPRWDLGFHPRRVSLSGSCSAVVARFASIWLITAYVAFIGITGLVSPGPSVRPD